MDKLDTSLERFFLILGDLRLAKEYADYIVSADLHSKTGNTKQLIHRALNTSMIISYCRPFTRNLDGTDAGTTDSPIYYLARTVLGRERLPLHKRILSQRHSVYAHAPVGKRYPMGVRSSITPKVDVFVPLTLVETNAFRAMINLWLDYLLPRRPVA